MIVTYVDPSNWWSRDRSKKSTLRFKAGGNGPIAYDPPPYFPLQNFPQLLALS